MSRATSKDRLRVPSAVVTSKLRHTNKSGESAHMSKRLHFSTLTLDGNSLIQLPPISNLHSLHCR